MATTEVVLEVRGVVRVTTEVEVLARPEEVVVILVVVLLVTDPQVTPSTPASGLAVLTELFTEVDNRNCFLAGTVH